MNCWSRRLYLWIIFIARHWLSNKTGTKDMARKLSLRLSVCVRAHIQYNVCSSAVDASMLHTHSQITLYNGLSLYVLHFWLLCCPFIHLFINLMLVLHLFLHQTLYSFNLWSSKSYVPSPNRLVDMICFILRNRCWCVSMFDINNESLLLYWLRRRFATLFFRRVGLIVLHWTNVRGDWIHLPTFFSSLLFYFIYLFNISFLRLMNYTQWWWVIWHYLLILSWFL